MDISRLNLFSALTDRMSYLGERQAVLAQNIANADTPGYQPRDLTPFKLTPMSGPGPVGPQMTNPKHLAGTRPTDGRYRADGSRKPYEVAPSGNAVILEEQMRLASRTNGDYQLTANLYQKNLGMLRSVLRSSGV